MEFLANENFPLLSVMLLRNASYRVVSIAQESPGITDFEVLKRAQPPPQNLQISLSD